MRGIKGWMKWNYAILIFQVIIMVAFVFYVIPYLAPMVGFAYNMSDMVHVTIAMFLGAVASVPLWKLFRKYT
jgi:PDZ domain-containing secreted protein